MTAFPYHHGSTNDRMGAREFDDGVFHAYLGNIICICHHIPQVSNMSLKKSGGEQMLKTSS